MANQAHWNNIYRTKQRNEVSWYAPHLSRSISYITDAAQDKSAAIIDIGAGESTLVEDLLDRGYNDLSLLDISDEALTATKERLGERGRTVQWYVGDITADELPTNRFDIWHDRAVFHFLLDSEQRKAYVSQICRSVKHGGHVVIATFAEEGPVKCSGLPVVRYTASSLSTELGEGFNLIEQANEEHITPAGNTQKFIYCRFRHI